MRAREDLRDELEVLLGAARELSPDTDRYLAERFVTRLESERPRKLTLQLPRLGLRRRFAVALVALAIAAVGAPLTIRASTGAPAASCAPVMVRDYLSRPALAADAKHLKAEGYYEIGSKAIGSKVGNGYEQVRYGMRGGCGR